MKQRADEKIGREDAQDLHRRYLADFRFRYSGDNGPAKLLGK
jgi:hypothetical protein